MLTGSKPFDFSCERHRCWLTLKRSRQNDSSGKHRHKRAVKTSWLWGHEAKVHTTRDHFLPGKSGWLPKTNNKIKNLKDICTWCYLTLSIYSFQDQWDYSSHWSPIDFTYRINSANSKSWKATFKSLRGSGLSYYISNINLQSNKTFPVMHWVLSLTSFWKRNNTEEHWTSWQNLFFIHFVTWLHFNKSKPLLRKIYSPLSPTKSTYCCYMPFNVQQLCS